MENIILPQKLNVKKGAHENEAVATIEPCYYGYGTTIGNALRRVLLSSLPGAAVTGVKIKGATHEFTTLPYIKEDVVEITLNLKNLRLKIFSDEPIRLSLKAKGEKVVKASDIEPNSAVEIVNPDLVIATLTDKSSELDMELFVSQGRGYVATETRDKSNLEVGTIAIDSIFSPVRNVGYNVENTRVGQITNYDKVVLTIETDGSISPEEALKQASNILIDHFQIVAGGTEEKEEISAEETQEQEEVSKQEEVEDVKSEEVEEIEKEVEEKPKKKRGRPKKEE